MPVSAPSPGPISTTRSAGVGATRSTMARAIVPSRRKCCPRARRLLSEGTARRGLRRRARRELARERREDAPHLLGGGLSVAGVVDDEVGQLRLLGERHLAGDLPAPLHVVGAVTAPEARHLRRLV